MLVTEDEQGLRLDVYLAKHLPACSRAQARALLRRGDARVNGKTAAQGTRLAVGDHVTLADSCTPSSVPLAAPDLPLTIRYESDGCVVVDKPASMHTTPLSPGERNTLANALVARYPRLRGIGYQPLEPGLLHRLDHETSGLVLVAKTEQAFTLLKAAMTASQIEKKYLALVHGAPPDEGVISLPIGHDYRDRRRMQVQPDDTPTRLTRRSRCKAREATTHFRVVARGEALALLEVTIARGARHQIRAHLAARGWPICGDTLYGAPERAACPRHFLHASQLRFVDPTYQHAVDVLAPLPTELVAWLDAVKIPWPTKDLPQTAKT